MTDGPVHTVILQPRDTIVVRDARPFGPDPGARAATLAWPMPRTVAGALRSHLGTTAEPPLDWENAADQQTAASISQLGPLLVARTSPADAGWTVYFPAPRDAVLYQDETGRHLFCRRPTLSGRAREGISRPVPDNPRPIVADPATESASPEAAPTGSGQPPLVLIGNTERKPAPGHVYWSQPDLARWLLAGDQRAWNDQAGGDAWPDRTLGNLPKEARSHVAIDPETGTGREGALFTTVGLSFTAEPVQMEEAVQPAIAILCRVTVPDGMRWTPREQFLWLGGERRIAALLPQPADSPWPAVPPELRQALTETTRLRLQLVTPALFASGWQPGWLDGGPLPPALTGVAVKHLVTAIADRRIGVSGWDMVNRQERAVRYAAPAGSVYFLELERPLTPDQVDALWLGSACEREQDRRDGFGLVVPGVWDWEERS